MLFGLGPVVVFGASNFPLAYSTAGGDAAAAFAAGCPVIVKAHPMHAGTGELVSGAIIKAAKETGMPGGIFSNLNAQNFEVGQQLVLHPAIKAVGFTGGIQGGRALFDLAASRPEPIPVFAEMGSTNPIVIFPSALISGLDNWTSAYADSILSGTGQFCTSPGLIFLQQSSDSDRFIEVLSEKLISAEAGVMLHPDIHARFESGKRTMLSHSERSIEKEKTDGIRGRQALMVVSAEDFIGHESLRHEVFGPFAIIILCKEEKELLTALSALNGQLTGTVLGSEKEIKDNFSVVEILKQRVGRLIFNGVPTGVEVCPSMNHGGPYPASTDARFTAVGIDAVRRFARPVVYQNCPQDLLPLELRNRNDLGIMRRINGAYSVEDVN
jgi:NADP-dependent aldehyde dehydrogenase